MLLSFFKSFLSMFLTKIWMKMVTEFLRKNLATKNYFDSKVKWSLEEKQLEYKGQCIIGRNYQNQMKIQWF